MVKLVAKSAMDGLLPVPSGTLSLSEVTYDQIQSVALFRGQAPLARKILKRELKAELPLPNRVIGPVQWMAPEQYLILGRWVDGLEGNAAITDQSDAWAILSVQGHDVEDVLARLIPIDLRYTKFSEGQTARTLIGHMTGSVTRVASDRIDLMVMRSMAGTLVHEVAKAAELFASRK